MIDYELLLLESLTLPLYEFLIFSVVPLSHTGGGMPSTGGAYR